MNYRMTVAMTMLMVGSRALGAGREFEIELRVAKQTQVVFEPADFELVLVHRGFGAVSVPRPMESTDQWRIERSDGWVDCRSSLSVTPGAGPREWRRIPPRGEIELSFRPFSCPGNGENASLDFKDWTQVPGKYRIQVKHMLAPSAQSMPSSRQERASTDASGGSVISNAVTIEVRPALGIDAEALNWALENHHNPLDVEVVNRFPSSSYATTVLSRYVAPALKDPETVKAMLAVGKFPGERSVPDPNDQDGWKRLVGRDLAIWQIETGKRLLATKPEPTVAQRLRLSVALAQIRVGKKDLGEKELRLLEKDLTSPEGRWAAKFLAPAQEEATSTGPDPRQVYPTGRAAIVARMGAEMVEKYVTPRSAQYFEPRPGCIEKPESCSEAIRKPYAMVTFRFHMPEIPFVDVEISCIVDRDLKVWELFGAPDCVTHPRECKFPIDERAARSIASEAGLEPGRGEWRAKFGWNSGFESYIWGISNKLHENSGRIVLIDANDGRVLRIDEWAVMS